MSSLRAWRNPAIFLAALIVGQVVAHGYIAVRMSPIPDEFPNLCAGLAHLTYGELDFYSVNPPLLKMYAAVPAWLAGASVPEGVDRSDLPSRPEFDVGKRFGQVYGPDAFRYLVSARLALIPWMAAGTILAFLLARDLFSEAAARAAALLWSFSPVVLGYGSLLTFDVPAAVVGLAAVITFGWFLRAPASGTWALAGSAMGLALSVKFTWVVLIPCLAVWIVLDGAELGTTLRRMGWYAGVLLIAWSVLCASYGFLGMFRPLASYRFVSQSLRGPDSEAFPDNRFEGTVLGHLPVPLPSAMVTGIDIQKRDFERRHRTYLMGRVHEGGFWYYYLLGAWLKMPSLFGILLIWSLWSAPWAKRSLIPLALIPAAVFALVSAQVNLNNHVRYIFPAVGLLVVFASGAFGSVKRLTEQKVRFAVLVLCLAPPLWFFPHVLPFTNFVSGGPAAAGWWIGGSAVDWDQGWFALKAWIREREPEELYVYREPRRKNFAVLGMEVAGIERADFRRPGAVLLAIPISVRQSGFVDDWIRHGKRVEKLAGCIEIYRIDRRWLWRSRQAVYRVLGTGETAARGGALRRSERECWSLIFAPARWCLIASRVTVGILPVHLPSSQARSLRAC